MTAELPAKRIEPIALEATKAGPGRYVVSGAALGVDGEWTVEIAARVTELTDIEDSLQYRCDDRRQSALAFRS